MDNSYCANAIRMYCEEEAEASDIREKVEAYKLCLLLYIIDDIAMWYGQQQYVPLSVHCITQLSVNSKPTHIPSNRQRG